MKAELESLWDRREQIMTVLAAAQPRAMATNFSIIREIVWLFQFPSAPASVCSFFMIAHRAPAPPPVSTRVVLSMGTCAGEEFARSQPSNDVETPVQALFLQAIVDNYVSSTGSFLTASRCRCKTWLEELSFRRSS